jgi:hypothetical protein
MMSGFKFDDAQLQQYCDRVVSVMTSLPENIRPICALLDAWHWFNLTEGEQSPRVREIIKRLTSSELRASLKTWYLQHEQINGPASSFHRALENEIGEKLPLGNQRS